MTRTRISTVLVSAALAAVAACSSNDHFLVVHVTPLPSVHDAATIDIKLANAGTTLPIKTFDLTAHPLPASFSVDTPGRSGELDITINAHDDASTLVGTGSAAVDLSQSETTVNLEGADFVVNTNVSGDQYVTQDPASAGAQIGVASNDLWTVAFGEQCTTSCAESAHMFDPTGVPITANELAVSTTNTTTSANPAVAGAGGSTMVFWNYVDPASGPRKIGCAALDATSVISTPELLTTEPTDVDTTISGVSATALSTGNIAVSWSTYSMTAASEVVMSGVFTPSCMPAAAASIISTTNGASQIGGIHVAENQGKLLYAWTTGFAPYIRAGDIASGPTGTDMPFPTGPADPTENVQYVQVAPLGTGFAVLLRWEATDKTSPGRIELYRTDATGVVQGGPTLITDQSLSDTTSSAQMGVATRADGALLVVWHACPAAAMCDVFGRIVRPTGVPVGAAFELATTTENDQRYPSVAALSNGFVAAWNDLSDTGADTSGLAVRARVLNPPYDDASGILGAVCGGSTAPCGTGLVCAPGTDGATRCYETAATGASDACPHGGTSAAAVDGSLACTF